MRKKLLIYIFVAIVAVLGIALGFSACNLFRREKLEFGFIEVDGGYKVHAITSRQRPSW